MKFSSLKRKNKTAFSLIEFSIVIVVLSIMLVGVLSILTSFDNRDKVKVTTNHMSEVYAALKVYLRENGALPCPASIIAIKANDANYGKTAGTAGTCTGTGIEDTGTLVYGMLPVQDLGLPMEMAQDGFGSKLSYIVDVRFTLASTFGDEYNYDINDGGTAIITVEEITSGGEDQTDNTGVIFIILSHGANKSGAYGINSATKNATTTTDPDELSNEYAASFDATFVDYSERSDVFDDIMFFESRDLLVVDADAYDLITCPALTGDESGISYTAAGGSTTDMTWASGGQYGQTVVSTDECPSGYMQTVLKPTKKCNAFGEWQTSAIAVDYCGETAVTPPALSECSSSSGVISYAGGKTIFTFLHNDAAGYTYTTHTLTCPDDLTDDDLDILIIAGGGSGGRGDSGGGGGGGGGQVVSLDNQDMADTVYTIKVGSGGVGQYYGIGKGDGIDSSIYGANLGTNTSRGGSAGSSYIYNATIWGTSTPSPCTPDNGCYPPDNTPGSGGGGFGSTLHDNMTVAGSVGTYSGGAGINYITSPNYIEYNSGGGGGSSAGNGAAATQTSDYTLSGSGAHPGYGADGVASSITGTSIVYGGGGGGGGGGTQGAGSGYNPDVTIGLGGSGGGGQGCLGAVDGVDGTAGLGGGGGGGSGSCVEPALGGSGVVIVSYPTP